MVQLGMAHVTRIWPHATCAPAPLCTLQHDGPSSPCPGKCYGGPKTFVSPFYYNQLCLYLTIFCALPRYPQDARVLSNHSITPRVSLNFCKFALRLGSCTWSTLPTVLSSRPQAPRYTKKRRRQPKWEGGTNQACRTQEEPL